MRVVFHSGEQQSFLKRIQQLSGKKTSVLAKRAGVCERTFRDWRREKWQMDDDSLDRLCQLAHLPRPRKISLLPEHWSTAKAGRIGGLRRIDLHGLPGTIEDRQRGGLTTQARIRRNPSLARTWGVTTRKIIRTPPHSKDLAEFIGIFLGDGGFRNPWQISISFNYRADRAHAEFIIGLTKRLFHLNPTCLIREGQSGDLVISSIALVEFIERELGIVRGRKSAVIKRMPQWILADKNYRAACLRGLMDTDGCVYQHRYRVNGKQYAYTKMGFAGTIPCLCQFVEETLKQVGVSAHTRQLGQRVFIDSERAVRKYFAAVGTHNPRYQQRFDEYSRIQER